MWIIASNGREPDKKKTTDLGVSVSLIFKKFSGFYATSGLHHMFQIIRTYDDFKSVPTSFTICKFHHNYTKKILRNTWESDYCVFSFYLPQIICKKGFNFHATSRLHHMFQSIRTYSDFQSFPKSFTICKFHHN